MFATYTSISIFHAGAATLPFYRAMETSHHHVQIDLSHSSCCKFSKWCCNDSCRPTSYWHLNLPTHWKYHRFPSLPGKEKLSPRPNSTLGDTISDVTRSVFERWAMAAILKLFIFIFAAFDYAIESVSQSWQFRMTILCL